MKIFLRHVFHYSFFILALSFVSSAAQSEKNATHLVFMIYMSGSDLETIDGAASRDINEIVSAIPSVIPEIKIVLMASGSKEWKNEIDSAEASIYEISDAGLIEIKKGTLQSMGSPKTLTSFLDFVYNNYPAQEYALILWNHGGGPMMGVCFDEQFSVDGLMDSLTLAELEKALAASPFSQRQLALIGFDACLMSSLETAVTVSPYARYMVASQEIEPVSGWDYRFLKHIDAQMSPVEVGKLIADTYFKSLSTMHLPIGISLLNLSLIPAVIAELDEIFDGINLALTYSDYVKLTECRLEVRSMAPTSPNDYDLIDLVDLLLIYHDAGIAACEELIKLIRKMIITNLTNSEFTNGLSVYYPYYNKEAYLENWRKEMIASSSEYDIFLRKIISLWLDESTVDWDCEMNSIQSCLKNDVFHIMLKLNAEQYTDYGRSELYVLNQITPKEYQPLYVTPNVSIHSDYSLEGCYEGTALYFVDDTGDVITDAITYYVHDDALFVPSLLMSDYSEDGIEILPVFLAFLTDKNDTLFLADIVESSNELFTLGKSTIHLEDWNELIIPSYTYMPIYKDNGMPSDFKKWQDASTVCLNHININADGLHPEFRKIQSCENLFGLLQLYDKRNNLAFSELFDLNLNPKQGIQSNIHLTN